MLGWLLKGSVGPARSPIIRSANRNAAIVTHAIATADRTIGGLAILSVPSPNVACGAVGRCVVHGAGGQLGTSCLPARASFEKAYRSKKT